MSSNARFTLVSGIIALLLSSLAASSHAGKPLFKSFVTHKTGSYTEAASIGDVNGDGKADVVVTATASPVLGGSSRIHVYLQNDRGELSAPETYTAGNGTSIDIGDVNGDGRRDIVLSAENGIDILLQRKDGSLSPAVSYPSNHESDTNSLRVRTGDFNNDGLLDVVSIDSGKASSDVDFFFQKPNGMLNAPISYTVEHGPDNDLSVGDVNNDDLMDIVVMSGEGALLENIGILHQNPFGGFLLPYYYDLGKSEVTRSAAVGDINGDNRPDLVFSSKGSAFTSSIGILFQNDAGKLDEFVRFYPSSSPPGAIALADVNLDDRQDVIVAHGGKSLLAVYTQKEDGTLEAEGEYPIPYAGRYNPHGIATGDINGDGATDVVIADPNHGLVVMYHLPPPPPIPDLAGKWSDFSVDYVGETQVAEGYFEMTNRGNGEAKNIEVSYYLSEDPVLNEADTEIGRLVIKSLSPGETIWPRFDYRSAIYLQGEFVIAVIDGENIIPERDEGNNLSATPMAHMAVNMGEVREEKAFVRRACSSNYCNAFIKKIKEFYR